MRMSSIPHSQKGAPEQSAIPVDETRYRTESDTDYAQASSPEYDPYRSSADKSVLKRSILPAIVSTTNVQRVISHGPNYSPPRHGSTLQIANAVCRHTTARERRRKPRKR